VNAGTANQNLAVQRNESGNVALIIAGYYGGSGYFQLNTSSE
jgi:hypothetical protein